jgi:hypothetical protein
MKAIVLIFLASLFTCSVFAQSLSYNKKKENFEVPQRSFPRKVPRILKDVPQQQFPRPGECRIWYPNRSLGEQPPPMKCEALIGIMLKEGAFILTYGGKAYDAEYDWKKDANNEKAKEKNGKIPQAVIDILFGPSKS